MCIKQADISDLEKVAPLISKFRVELLGYKNIISDEDIESAKEEFIDYINAGYPIYIYEIDDDYVGYLVCRIDNDVVWVESLYVLPKYRRKGIATALYNTAEELAIKYGNETLYNYVHPNNDNIINFLAKRGYDVLNLIEIRKKRKDEELTEKINIRNNTFNY